MISPLPSPVHYPLAVALRTGIDEPVLVNEPVRLPDLSDILSESWRDQVLRRGHSHIPLADAPIRVRPGLAAASRGGCDGVRVEVNLPDSLPRSHSFSIHSLRHVAERAAASLLKADLLTTGQQYYYEIAPRKTEAALVPEHPPRTDVLSVSIKTAPLRFLKVSLRGLLEQATPVDLLDDGSFPVFYTRAAFLKAETIAFKGASAVQPIETGGALVGSLAICQQTGELCAIIRDVIEVEEAEQTQFTLSYSSRTWALLHTLLRARQVAQPEDSFILMGQAHAHPFRPTDGKICAQCDQLPVCNLSSAFVSAEDRNWHRAVFAHQPWALCHIFGLSPRGEQVNRLFGLRDGRLQPRGWYVLPDFEPNR